MKGETYFKLSTHIVWFFFVVVVRWKWKFKIPSSSRLISIKNTNLTFFSTIIICKTHIIVVPFRSIYILLTVNLQYSNNVYKQKQSSESEKLFWFVYNYHRSDFSQGDFHYLFTDRETRTELRKFKIVSNESLISIHFNMFIVDSFMICCLKSWKAQFKNLIEIR